MPVQEAQETLRTILREKKLRPTRERDMILEEIMNGGGHFDADELYTRMRGKASKISRATVYNTLDLFVGCGLIFKYRFDEKHCRYERAFGRPRHDHLICLRCGDIIEFVAPELDRLQKSVCKDHRFRLESSSLQIFGLCRECQATEKHRKAKGLESK